MMTPRNLKIAFFGTPDFAVAVLDQIFAAGIVPTLLVTAPDKPKGRGLQLTPPPVKIWGDSHDIDVIQPAQLGGTGNSGEPELLNDTDLLLNTEWDLFIVASYGKILPKELVEKPNFGTLNVHPSLLPKFRGASPVRSAILSDALDAVGVTIIKLDDKMDHGPILAQARVELDSKDWPPRATILEDMLAQAGGELLAETIPQWVNDQIVPEEQEHDDATFCKKITKADGELDLADDPWKNFLKIRAFDGWPGTYFFHAGKRIKVVDAQYENGDLKITRVVPEGKKEMAYEVFLDSAN